MKLRLLLCLPTGENFHRPLSTLLGCFWTRQQSSTLVLRGVGLESALVDACAKSFESELMGAIGVDVCLALYFGLLKDFYPSQAVYFFLKTNCPSLLMRISHSQCEKLFWKTLNTPKKDCRWQLINGRHLHDNCQKLLLVAQHP